jgi:hypothetical protein
MIQTMKPSRSLHKAGDPNKDRVADEGNAGACLLRSLGWITAGVAAVTLGIVIGREVHQRYKFNRRTPYDMYSHSGDQAQDVEFGVGI